MHNKDQELEVKFYVLGLENTQTRLQELGATLVHPRTYEYNLRFDTPEKTLTQSGYVIRLRKDIVAHLTYKEPGITTDGVHRRKEIEFTVDDFDAARAFLEALGYGVSMVYEKYRAAYILGGVLVTLDEMPFGDFVEVEGPDASRIHDICDKLGFSWYTRITVSYAALFHTACQNLGVVRVNLTFKEFSNIEVLPHHLGVQPADG